MEEILDSKTIHVLDHGFVTLLDHLGDDSAIVKAARVSYANGTKTVREDKGLIDYLIRNEHSSPLEMVEFVFHLKLPIFVQNQLVRHRTANLNVMSGRYSVMPTEKYLPNMDRLQAQATDNKQGSGELLDQDTRHFIMGAMEADQEVVELNYNSYINHGLAREVARINLPLSQYTEMIWKMDLRNLLHFLKLRIDSHAQWEIQEYARAILELIEPIVPWAIESWKRHDLNAVKFSEDEMQVLRVLLIGGNTSQFSEKLLKSTRQKLVSNV